jgi:hypothetical protein
MTNTGKPFTSETARAAQQRSVEKRRENARTFREQMQNKLLEQDGAHLAAKLLSEEDWRAWIAAVEQAFGKPAEKAEVEHTGEVEVVVRSAFADSGSGAVPGDGEAERAGEGVERP